MFVFRQYRKTKDLERGKEMFEKKQMIPLAVFVVTCIFILAGCLYIDDNGTISADVLSVGLKSDKNTASSTQSLPLKEDRNVYRDDEDNSLVDFYITVIKSAGENGQYTFQDVNNDSNPNEDVKPAVEVIFQEGAPEGPEPGYFGYSANRSNGVMTARGSSNRGLEQQCYAVNLNSSAGLWRGQRRINLNKHISDITRVRQKLSFDYFKTIPGFSSLRTQFVHLHIKDLTKSTPDSRFLDYGLYTQIEQPNKRFLKSHGLDPEGNLYKAKEFLFLKDESLKNVEDPGYDKKAFESKLKINGKEDHRKLLDMIKDVNDDTKNINEVIDKHFNRENYLTWLAVNILMDNIDTFEQNFMLYSPSNSDTWYFMPWDYDGAWGFYEQTGVEAGMSRAQWMGGVSTYWTSILHQRFFKDPENIKQITKKIEVLSKIINREHTASLLKNYYNIAKRFVSGSPDRGCLPASIRDFEKEYRRLEDIPGISLKRYYENIQTPMPFHLLEPSMESDQYVFSWEQAFDLQGDPPTYHFQLATDPEFSDIVIDEDGLTDTIYTMDKPDPGTYYWRVTAYDGEGHEQIALGFYEDENNNNQMFYGEQEWVVE